MLRPRRKTWRVGDEVVEEIRRTAEAARTPETGGSGSFVVGGQQGGVGEVRGEVSLVESRGSRRR